MAGLDDLIETFPSLAPLANAVGMRKTTYADPELPRNLSSTNLFSPQIPTLSKQPLYSLPRSTVPADLPQNLKVYRADPTGKYGGKEGLETLPLSRFLTGGYKVGNKPIYEPDPNMETSTVESNPTKAVQEIYRHARLLGAADKYGYPTFSPEEAAAFVLKEGRSDMGHGSVGTKHPSDASFDKTLGETYNLHPNDRNFLAAIFSKKRVADKLGISLAEAWNGTGVNAAGQTGKQYAKNFEQQRVAALNPKNQELLKLIQKAMDDGRKHGLPLKADENKDTVRQKKEVPYKKGGAVDKPLQGGNKII
jgi:hypothetical protein